MGNDAAARRNASNSILNEVQAKIGYTFEQPALLRRALTHCSSTIKDGVDNSSFAFLGDGVLHLTVDSVLLVEYPELPPGELSKRKVAAMNMARLADAAKELGLERLVRFGAGLSNQLEIPVRVLADSYQAMCGAIFLDLGFEAARAFVKRSLNLSGPIEPISNPKSDLQSWSQAHLAATPRYQVLSQSGPDHHVVFEVCVYIKEKAYGKGRGTTKHQAEANAAAATLKQVGNVALITAPPPPPKPVQPRPAPVPAQPKKKNQAADRSKPKRRPASPSRRFGCCPICHKYVDDINAHRANAHRPPSVFESRRAPRGHNVSPYMETPKPDYIANPYADENR